MSDAVPYIVLDDRETGSMHQTHPVHCNDGTIEVRHALKQVIPNFKKEMIEKGGVSIDGRPIVDGSVRLRRGSFFFVELRGVPYKIIIV